MVLVTINGNRGVDVSDADCGYRTCYQFGFDKGPFTAGVGYTRPETPWRPVCLTRHLHGCPHKAPADGVEELDDDDGSVLLKLIDPTPCCDSPRVHNRGTAQSYRQRCLSCGEWLTGGRLELARGTYDPGIRVVLVDGRYQRAA